VIRRLVSHSSIPIDLALEVPHLPERGGDVLVSRSGLSAGGGFNVLSAAVRLGLPAVYAGQHGTGPFGDMVREALAGEGIAWLQPANPELDTGYTVVLVEGGERTFVTATGADGVVRADALRAMTYQAGDAVFVSGYDLAYPGSAAAVADHAAALPADVHLVFDPGPLIGQIAPAALRTVLERTDLLSLNSREAVLLGGSRAQLRISATVIVRSGPDGATLEVPGGGRQTIPAVATLVVDSTGAGDVHVGATLAGLARGLDLAEAVLLANRAAAYAVSRWGAAAGPTQDQLDEFGAERW
jgi:sugar/nucleoside kinase (ribokinase family)